MDPSWGVGWTIVPFSGWFNWVDGAIAQSVIAVDLLLSTVLQFLGDLPGVPALVSMGIWQMSPLGEAVQCLRLAPRLCFSLRCDPPQLCSVPPPSLDKRWGLIANNLVIVPSNFSLELQYYWSWIYSRQQNHSDVWGFWIVHWIYILIKWLKFWKYSDI